MGKKAIVTGGIGAAIVATLLRDGFDVVFNFNSQKVKADAMVTALSQKGGKVAAFQADLRQFTAATAFISSSPR